MKRSNLAIIPARGGSKGIPRKNVLLLAGKPLIAWNIEAAKAADHVDRVVVSTDDPEIVRISKQYGAEVVERPLELAGDKASSESALLHVLEHLEQTEKYQPDLVIFLQCTSPLTAAEDIDGTVQVLMEQQAQTSLAVIDFHYFVWKPNEQGDAVGVNHDKSIRPLRQDREPQYLETGAVYVMEAAGFREHKHRFFGKTAMYVMPAHRRLEIDEPVDFQVAQVLLCEQSEKEKLALLPQQVDAVIFDFDGVFTDNGVIVREDGSESVYCSRGDGMGITLLRKTGLPMLILSKEPNPVVLARAAKLKLPCMHGIDDKLPVLKQWLDEKGLSLANTIYVGNDVNDLACLQAVGCPVVVADAHPDTLDSAKLVLSNAGGRGAVRELCDLVLAKLKSR